MHGGVAAWRISPPTSEFNSDVKVGDFQCKMLSQNIFYALWSGSIHTHELVQVSVRTLTCDCVPHQNLVRMIAPVKYSPNKLEAQ